MKRVTSSLDGTQIYNERPATSNMKKEPYSASANLTSEQIIDIIGTDLVKNPELRSTIGKL